MLENNNQISQLKQAACLNNFKKQFHIIESPTFISHLCNIVQDNNRSYHHEEIDLQSLINSGKVCSYKKINCSREKYREIKQKIISSMKIINKNSQLTLSQLFLWKQEILTNFLNQFLIEIAKECKEKSEILVYVWNTIFNLIQYLMQIVIKTNQKGEKDYLSSLLQNHQSYQQIITNLNHKIRKMQQQKQRQNKFIQALVYNLRYKRKQIKKLTKSLKMCTLKLNEFKDFYLDLQTEHIDLLAQNRDITKENALNLIKRKQEINLEKRIQYKMKQSRKKIHFQIQNQINFEDTNEKENIDKLGKEMKSAFNKVYSNKVQISEKHIRGIFQNAFENFNLRVKEQSQAEDFIDFKNKTVFIDASTDMMDFMRDVQEREVQITNNDLLFYDFICHASIQTMDVKVKPKIFVQSSTQINEKQLKVLLFSRVKVIDRSYLLSDYRDKRYKQKQVVMKINAENSLKSMKSIYKQPRIFNLPRNCSMQQQGVQKTQRHSQTEDVFILNVSHIPAKFRNTKLEKQIQIYTNSLYKTENQINQSQNEDSFMARTPNFRGKLAFNRKNKKLNTVFRGDYQSEEKDSIDKIVNKEQKQIQSYKTSRLSTARTKLSNQKNSHHKATSSLKNLPNIQSKNNIVVCEQIQQNQYQDQKSTQINNKQHLTAILRNPIRKYWVLRPDIEELSNQKKRFLNDLKRSDQLFSKSATSENYLDYRKIMVDLQKISQEIQNNAFGQIQYNINQNINVLREELKKMLLKKRNNRKLAASRFQSLTKTISLVYTFAYHLLMNHQKPLTYLIIPLFHHFKLGYGEIKKNDLYLRMLYFLSQIICHKDQYFIFQIFIHYLGLNLDSNEKIKIGRQNTCLHLRLLYNLSINFKFPLNVDQLYTTVGFFDKKVKKVLQDQKYDEGVINKVYQKVKAKLDVVVLGIDEEKVQTTNQNYNDVKVNVFKVCKLVLDQIQKLKNTLYDSYIHLFELFKTIEEIDQKDFIDFVLKNMQLKITDFKKYRKICHEKTCSIGEDELQKNVNIFLQISIPDLNKVYFKILAKYKIKQQFLYLSIKRRMAFLIKYIEGNESLKVQHCLIKYIINQQETSILKQLVNKKILAFVYLQIIDFESCALLEDILGDDLKCLYSIDIA